MLMADLDRWISRTLFAPVLIEFCELTRQTPFAASRLFLFLAMMDGFYTAQDEFGLALFGSLGFYMAVRASTWADSTAKSYPLVRAIVWAIVFYGIMKGCLTGEWVGTEFWILVVMSEYAKLIGHVSEQPLETPNP